MPQVIITERQAEAVARLVVVKRAYDSHEVFRSGHLVAPGSA
jgi:hypothetical protein